MFVEGKNLGLIALLGVVASHDCVDVGVENGLLFKVELQHLQKFGQLHEELHLSLCPYVDLDEQHQNRDIFYAMASYSFLVPGQHFQGLFFSLPIQQVTHLLLHLQNLHRSNLRPLHLLPQLPVQPHRFLHKLFLVLSDVLLQIAGELKHLKLMLLDEDLGSD